ncbi:unnamed protein product [Paramecium octaurelia]|uniref:Uncharacterized protein n=1 Tax=Paramecium octaurelia TaxID=43137 RepID=A0A8S1YH29_PAROT|nr:unnamed protein product [Paramecium octaurelia]
MDQAKKFHYQKSVELKKSYLIINKQELQKIIINNQQIVSNFEGKLKERALEIIDAKLMKQNILSLVFKLNNYNILHLENNSYLVQKMAQFQYIRMILKSQKHTNKFAMIHLQKILFCRPFAMRFSNRNLKLIKGNFEKLLSEKGVIA